MIIEALVPYLSPGEVAALMDDWTIPDSEDGLVLHGRSPRVTMPLLPSVLESVFSDAFGHSWMILAMLYRCDTASPSFSAAGGGGY